MRPLSPRQVTAMIEHLAADHATLRIAFAGGHRETLIILREPAVDGLITGETWRGDRIDFDAADVCAITYVRRDEKVMTAEEIASYEPGSTTPAQPDEPIRVRQRAKKAAAAVEAEQPDEQPAKPRSGRAPRGNAGSR